MSESKNNESNLPVGTICGGDLHSYEIGEELGSGGMGTVYRAKVVGKDREVALKVLHAEFSEEGSSSRERFEREIHVLTDLKAFRGIVRIEDWGNTDTGGLFLVMELVLAPTLAAILEENDRGLGQLEAIQIVVEVLNVLEPIHRRRFLHRDLKPHNIAVYRNPLSVRILDFGLSKPYQEGVGYDKVTRRVGAKAQEIPGSPHYMAVEQFLRPKDVDARTDLYAIGIILYELLAGVPPFRGIYLQDILKQHRENEPPAIATTADGKTLSYRVAAVLEKALAKKREARYQDAGEFKDALYDVLNALNRAERPLKVLDTEYSILRKLGAGGNSDVFEAERTETGELVAMKVAREGGGDWDRETLLNEADRALKHPNIVPIVEFGSLEGRPALVMELMSAGTVEDFIQKYADDGFPEDLFYRVIIDVCRGLHHAHVSNIVHRDVKPANMLVAEDGTVKMCDFGIAKRFEQAGAEIQGSKNTMMAKGTAQYMPPEQCDLQGRADKRSDVYALGCVIYEMLAGMLPFSEGILLMQHMQSDPPPLEVKGNFQNPDALCALVERCMKKRKDDRFQSMKELAQELVRIKKLAPQKRAHKPVALSTKADNDETELVEQMGTRPAPARSKLTMMGVPIIMLAVVTTGYFSGWFNTDPTPSPNPISTEDDTKEQASLSAKAAAESLLVASDHEALSSFESSELTKTHRQQLAMKLRFRALQELRKRPAVRIEAMAHQRSTSHWIAAHRHFAGDAQAMASIAALNDQLKTWGELPGPETEGGPERYEDKWWESFKSVLKAAAPALVGTDYPEWTNWMNRQQMTTWRYNRDRALKILQASTLDSKVVLPDQFSDDLQGLTSRDPAREGHRDLFTAVQLWMEASSVSIDTVGTLAEHILKTAPAAVGETLTLSSLPDELRSRRAGRPAPASIRDGVLNALNSLDDGTHLAALIAASSPSDPRGWGESRAALAKVGIRKDVFPFSLVRGFIQALDPEKLGQRLSGNLDAKKTAIESMDKAVRELSADLGAPAQPLVRAWQKISEQHRVSELALSRVQILESLGALSAKSSIDEISSAWKRCSQFERRIPSGDEGFGALRGQLSEDLLKEGRAFTLLLLKPYLAGTDWVSKAEAAIRAALSNQHILQAEYRSGLPLTTRFNASWRKSAVPCIQLIYPLNPGDMALFGAGGALRFKVAGGSVRVDEAKHRLHVQLSPGEFLRTDSGSTSSASAGRVVFRLLVMGETDQVASLLSLDVSYPGPSAKDSDFVLPKLKSIDVAPNGETVVVTVVDDRELSAEGLKELRFAGREAMTFSPTVEITAGRATLTFKAKLELLSHLADGNEEPLIAGLVSDRLGNSIEVQSSVRTRTLISRLRRRLLNRCDQQRSLWNASAKSVANLSSTIQLAIQTLDGLQPRLQTYKVFDRIDAQVFADRVLRDISNGFVRILQPRSLQDKAWLSLEKNYSSMVERTADFENRLGSGQVNSRASLTACFAAARAIRSTTSKPVATIDWNLADIDLKGIRFILLLDEKGEPAKPGGVPVWMMATELSVGHILALGESGERINRLVRGDGKRKDRRWRDPEDNMPLTPLSLRRASDVVQAFGKARNTSAVKLCGGPVAIALPTREMWQIAARMQRQYQAKGRGDYPFGEWSRSYGFSGVRGKDGHPPFSDLDSVDGDTGSLFQFLGGNVSEWVRTGRRLQAWGGSYSDRRPAFRIDNTRIASTQDRAGVRLILTRK